MAIEQTYHLRVPFCARMNSVFAVEGPKVVLPPLDMMFVAVDQLGEWVHWLYMGKKSLTPWTSC